MYEQFHLKHGMHNIEEETEHTLQDNIKKEES
jgi:hypothetical protein